MVATQLQFRDCTEDASSSGSVHNDHDPLDIINVYNSDRRPLKIVQIFSPINVKTDVQNFRALVQELTGIHSDIDRPKTRRKWRPRNHYRHHQQAQQDDHDYDAKANAMSDQAVIDIKSSGRQFMADASSASNCSLTSTVHRERNQSLHAVDDDHGREYLKYIDDEYPASPNVKYLSPWKKILADTESWERTIDELIYDDHCMNSQQPLQQTLGRSL